VALVLLVAMLMGFLLLLSAGRFGPRVTKSISLVLLITGALLMGNAHYRCLRRTIH